MTEPTFEELTKLHQRILELENQVQGPEGFPTWRAAAVHERKLRVALETNQILVGVAVLIKDDRGRVLVGRRLGKHGHGTWCPPGGHLEFGETIEAAAAREVLEETGMVVVATKQLTTISDVVTEVVGKQYITIWLEVQVEKLEPKNMEPEKCAGWEWRPVHEVPQPHFLAFSNYLKDLDVREGQRRNVREIAKGLVCSILGLGKRGDK